MKTFLIVLIASSVFDGVENQKGVRTDFSKAMASFIARCIEHLWKDCLVQKYLEEHLDAFKECIQQPWTDNPETHVSLRGGNLCKMFALNTPCSEEFVNNVPQCAVKKSRNHRLLNLNNQLMDLATPYLCEDPVRFQVVKAFSEDPNIVCNFKLTGAAVACKGAYVKDLFDGNSKDCWIWRKLERCVQDAMVNEREKGCEIQKFRNLVDLQAVSTTTNFQPTCKINHTLPSKEEAKIPYKPPTAEHQRGSKPSASIESAPVSETLLQISILWVMAAKTLFSFDSN